MAWIAYQDGETLGMTGMEGGQIQRDELEPVGARITLERDCLRVPYAITIMIRDAYDQYGSGWWMHKRFYADEPTALQQYDALRDEATALLDHLPPDDDYADWDAKAARMNAALEAFLARYP